MLDLLLRTYCSIAEISATATRKSWKYAKNVVKYGCVIIFVRKIVNISKKVEEIKIIKSEKFNDFS